MDNPLRISALEATGGLVSGKPVPKEIDWYQIVDGERVPAVYTVHVLCLPFQRIEDVTRTAKSVTVGLIAEGILFDDGQTKLTPDQAARLDKELTTKLITVFNEVNGSGPGDAGKSKSPKQMSSGTK